MDSQQEQQSFSLKILVDKELQKVVVAEATKDFVDTLFSFLTLPLGTIIRLVGNKHLQHPASLGSINNLYQSVENLDIDNFLNDICKNMLLNPRNPCHALCSKLLLNVDNTQPPKYFTCSNYCTSMSPKYTLSAFANARCTCGGLMDLEKIVAGSEEEEAKIKVEGGVFVKRGSKYLVFDDLKVMPSSIDNSLQLLIQLGYGDFSRLEETFVNIGLQEMLELLKNVLISQEPLTNTFLENDIKRVKQLKLSAFKVSAKSDDNEDSCKMNIKVICSKSKNKIVGIEAKEDFVDFIFGFLTIPLGSILKLLGGNSCVGCVDNLYNSVGNMDKRWCTNSHSILMDPGVAPQFSCPKQPLKVSMLEPLEYISYSGKLVIHTQYPQCSPYYNMDPRAPNGKIEDVVGFVKRPASYVVGDDLQMSPLESTSMLSFVKEFNLPFDDIEVSVLCIGEEEALNLLRASLTSKSTLNTGLADLLKTAK